MRYQQLYLGSEVGTGLITEVAFRQDAAFGAAFGPATLSGFTMSLSSTDTQIDDISQTFAENIGADEMLVVSGDLVLESPPTERIPSPLTLLFRSKPRSSSTQGAD